MSEPISPGEPAAAARTALVEALVATGEQDRSAFQRVYRLTSAKLFGVCLRICGDRQAAEDVLHEVYLTVWKRAGGYEPGRSSPITWLATIARNRATYTTVQGEPLTFMQSGRGWAIMDAKGGHAMITFANVMQSNGVIHVIDTVLMP